MGLFEFLGESFNPGEIARVEMDQPSARPPKNIWVLVFGLVSVGLLTTAVVFMVRNATSTRSLLIGSGLLAVYLLIGFFYRVSIPSDNLGLFGTPIDHPFRISDDINRFYLLLLVLFAPGKFVSVSIYNLFLLGRAYWRNG